MLWSGDALGAACGIEDSGKFKAGGLGVSRRTVWECFLRVRYMIVVVVALDDRISSACCQSTGGYEQKRHGSVLCFELASAKVVE